MTSVCASRYDVTTHDSRSTLPSSPTIVGNAVATMVESSAASNIASSRPVNNARNFSGGSGVDTGVFIGRTDFLQEMRRRPQGRAVGSAQTGLTRQPDGPTIALAIVRYGKV